MVKNKTLNENSTKLILWHLTTAATNCCELLPQSILWLLTVATISYCGTVAPVHIMALDSSNNELLCTVTPVHIVTLDSSYDKLLCTVAPFHIVAFDSSNNEKQTAGRLFVSCSSGRHLGYSTIYHDIPVLPDHLCLSLVHTWRL